MSGKHIFRIREGEEDRIDELMQLPESNLRAFYLRVSGRRGRTNGAEPETMLGRRALAELIVLYERD